MNKIKFTNYNDFDIPQSVILTINNEEIHLEKIKYVKYYDKAFTKSYKYLPTVYKINNNYYA